jgi:hypothetical protein
MPIGSHEHLRCPIAGRYLPPAWHVWPVQLYMGVSWNVTDGRVPVTDLCLCDPGIWRAMGCMKARFLLFLSDDRHNNRLKFKKINICCFSTSLTCRFLGLKLNWKLYRSQGCRGLILISLITSPMSVCCIHNLLTFLVYPTLFTSKTF